MVLPVCDSLPRLGCPWASLLKTLESSGWWGHMGAMLITFPWKSSTALHSTFRHFGYQHACMHAHTLSLHENSAGRVTENINLLAPCEGSRRVTPFMLTKVKTLRGTGHPCAFPCFTWLDPPLPRELPPNKQLVLLSLLCGQYIARVKVFSPYTISVDSCHSSHKRKLLSIRHTWENPSCSKWHADVGSTLRF